MPTLTKMIVDYRKPTEIAEWLYTGENQLDELNTYESFVSKAAAVDVAVWKMCQNKGNLKRYLEIYGKKGSHSQEVLEAIQKEDDDAWNKACASGTSDAFDSYLNEFGSTGRHYDEAQSKKDEVDKKDEDAWKEACRLDTYEAYKSYSEKFKNHASKAEAKMKEILEEQAKLKEADEAAWKEACTLNTYDDYKSYSEKFKNHASEAKSKMDDIVIGQDAARRAEEARRAEDALWNEAVKMNTIASYQSYLDSYPYPSGRYANDAIDKKTILENEKRAKDEQEKAEKKREMIAALEKNPNAYELAFIKNCGIKVNDLRGKIKDSEGKVHDELLDCWNAMAEELEMGETPSSIPDGTTEVYFWGIPGSGKTCAMAAILSRAQKMGCFEPEEGPGLTYMTQLASVFHPEDSTVSILPERSPVETTQYLPFILNEVRAGNAFRRKAIIPHKISIIELSGEIFECFACKMQGKPFPSPAHKETFNHLVDYLKGGNPKYHFFIMDSSPTKKAKQTMHLQQATLYFKKHNVFNKTTQGISLIVTKCDTLTNNPNEREKCARKFALDTFPAFVNTLSGIVGPAGLKLTNGSVPVHPLSIGQVFFQQMCLFDPDPATELVETLMDYARADELNNRLNFLNN